MCTIKLDAFRKAGEGLYGNISAMARRLGVSRRSLYRFLDSSPEAAEFIASQREEFDDLAEEKIQSKILEGDSAMLKFYASTKLRRRGYSSDDPEKKDVPPEFKVTIETKK